MNRALAAMLVAICFFSLSTVGSKFMLNHLAFAQISFVRFAVASLVLWSVVLASGGIRHLRALSWRGFALGIVEPGMVSLTFVWGLTMTNATHGAVLWALAPVMIPWMGLLILRERLTWVNYVSSALAIAGAGVLISADSGKGGEGTLTGDLICAGSVVLSACAALFARRIATVSGNALMTTATQVTSAALLCLLTDLAVQPSTAVFDLPGSVWAFFLPWSIAAGAAPFILYNYAMKHMPVAQIALFPPLVAPVGTAMAAVWLGEPLHFSIILAIALILGGVMLPVLLRMRAQAG